MRLQSKSKKRDYYQEKAKRMQLLLHQQNIMDRLQLRTINHYHVVGVVQTLYQFPHKITHVTGSYKKATTTFIHCGTSHRHHHHHQHLSK